ncbi:hypothetical protein SASPL_104764 [Salvia splendens]|uniref:Protein FAR1-RELATED SEQUENCE n=1 Tax=Salvia splendens TaxID=180675 RepID=A0A8X8YNA8_SALSN|nr:hypothetical protein SASPL_104764 [Salvia splendens]
MSSLIKTTSISESQNIFFKRYSKFRSNLVEFLMNYNNALDGQRSNNNRLEYLDFNTIPTLKTNSAIEKHASTIYSDSGFKLIQSEIEEAVDNAVHCGFDDDIETFIVVDETKQEYRDMHGDFYNIARLIEGDGDKSRTFTQIMAEGRKEVLDNMVLHLLFSIGKVVHKKIIDEVMRIGWRGCWTSCRQRLRRGRSYRAASPSSVVAIDLRHF